MDYLERFKKKMNRSGGSIRKEYIQNTRNLLKEVFEDDPTADFEAYIWRIGLLEYEDFTNEPRIYVRLYDEKFSAANGNTVSFETQYNCPIVVGDIIFVRYYNENIEDEDKRIIDRFYICTESFNIANENWQGKFTLCNWILKWQDSNGEILKYPCYDMNSTQYNSGERSSKMMTVGSSQHIITLPCDDNTVELCTPRRFFLDKSKRNPTTFAVTQNDTTSYNYGKGLVKVTVAECPTNIEKDNFELGVCDYFEKNQNDSADLSKIISDKYYIISGGGNQRFKAEFYNSNGESVDIEPKWDIVCDFSDKITVIKDSAYIYLSIDDDDYIDEKFKLCVSDDNGNYSSSIIIDVKSLL